MRRKHRVSVSIQFLFRFAKAWKEGGQVPHPWLWRHGARNWALSPPSQPFRVPPQSASSSGKWVSLVLRSHLRHHPHSATSCGRPPSFWLELEWKHNISSHVKQSPCNSLRWLCVYLLLTLRPGLASSSTVPSLAIVLKHSLLEKFKNSRSDLPTCPHHEITCSLEFSQEALSHLSPLEQQPFLLIPAVVIQCFGLQKRRDD